MLRNVLMGNPDVELVIGKILVLRSSIDCSMTPLLGRRKNCEDVIEVSELIVVEVFSRTTGLLRGILCGGY